MSAVHPPLTSADANRLRWHNGASGHAGKGHYESYFLRANHATQKQAFWLRYTLFIPAHPTPGNQPTAELWGAWFNNDQVLAIQENIPLTDCDFRLSDDNNLQLNFAGHLLQRAGEAQQAKGFTQGRVSKGLHSIGWQLTYQGGEAVLPLFPEALYDRRFPKAKVLVGLPNTRFSGTLWINGEALTIGQWQGSENHNWGSKHTDEYAWGQVCGFDNETDSFLECATARVKAGPLLSPPFTVAVLRIRGEEYRFHSPWQALRNRGHYGYFHWQLQARNGDLTVQANLRAEAHDVAGLNYRNPPAGSHTCLNTKVAMADVTLQRHGKVLAQLHSAHGAAFEILTDDHRHGIQICN